MRLKTTLAGRTYEFKTVKEVLAKANEQKSGDVLAGILVSLLGQGLPPVHAAAAAAWLHGTAADRCAARMGEYGLLPSDVAAELPYLLP